MVNSRVKGATYETKIVKILEKATGKKWTRSPQSGGIATRTGNMALAGDIIRKGKPSPYVIECKKYKEVNLEDLVVRKGNMLKWVAQLEREKGNRKGILIFCRNYGKDMCLVETDREIPNTLKYNQYTLGLLTTVLEEIATDF